MFSTLHPPPPSPLEGLEQGHDVRYQGSSGPSLSFPQPPDSRQQRRRLNSEGAAVSPGWEGEPLNLPPSIEDHHTSTPSLGASIRCSIREQMEVDRTHLLQAGLSSLPLDIQGFSFCRLGVVEVEGEILSPWGQSDAVIVLANFMLQGLKVRDAAPQSLADCPPSLLPGSLGDPSLHQVSPDISRVQGPPSLVLGQSCPFCSFPQCLQPRLSEHHIRRRTPHHSRNRSGCSSLYSLHSLPCRPRCPGVPCWGSIL